MSNKKERDKKILISQLQRISKKYNISLIGMGSDQLMLCNERVNVTISI